MPLPSFLRFTPVPLKARHDGWSAELQFQFILALARGARPDRAAKSVGMSRQGAYALRKRPGAEGFAAAWDAALRHARLSRIAMSTPTPAPSANGPERRISPEAVASARTSVAGGSDARAAFDAFLDRLYPREAAKADKIDKADRKPM